MKKEFIPNDKVVFEKYDWNTPVDSRSIYLNGIYAHGEIQDVIGHDIVRVYSGFDNILNRVIDRTEFTTSCYIKHKGMLLNCTIFFWVCGTMNRGLIVLDSDVRWMEDAKSKFEERRSSL